MGSKVTSQLRHALSYDGVRISSWGERTRFAHEVFTQVREQREAETLHSPILTFLRIFIHVPSGFFK